MNTLFSASRYRIAMKIGVLESYKQIKSLITIQKLAENLRNFEIGPSDVCQYITLKNSMSIVYLELSRETYTRKLYTDELQ